MTDGTRVIKKRTRKYIKIPYDFFERHLPLANANYLKIYLYAYYAATNDESELNSEIIMEKLGVSREEIEAAWQYFSKAGLISIEENSIEFLDLETVYKSGRNASPHPASAVPKKKADAVRFLAGNTEFKKQISYIEMQIGSEISHKDLEELYDLFVENRVPFDVVAAAAGHCVSRGIKNISYISKVAFELFSQGLTDYEKIEEYLWNKEQHIPQMAETDKYTELRELFLLNRDFYDIEKKYIDSWVGEYGATKEKIKDAIDKTILNTGKINFPYIDKVIKTNAAGTYQKPLSTVSYGKKTAFHNYNQSGFDYDKISEALRAKQTREK
jgi:DNA replication protein DnaD